MACYCGEIDGMSIVDVNNSGTMLLLFICPNCGLVFSGANYNGKAIEQAREKQFNKNTTS